MQYLRRKSLSLPRRLVQQMPGFERPRRKDRPKEETIRGEQSPSETDVQGPFQPQPEGGKNLFGGPSNPR